MIPKYIHFMWLDKKDPYKRGYPDKYKDNIQAWADLNPDAKVIMWNYSDIEREFPDYMDHIRRIPVWISKCDLSRFLVLQKYGGIYFDMDFIPLRPLDSTIYDRDILIVQEPEEHTNYGEKGRIFNGVVGSSPNHPFISGWISEIIHTIDTVSSFDWNVMTTTGPTAFYNYYDNNWRSALNIDPKEFCMFVPVVRPVRNNSMNTSYIKDECASIEPFCYTSWEDGTDWYKDLPYKNTKLIFILITLLVLTGAVYWILRKPKRR